MNTQQHWNNIYKNKSDQELSWFQTRAETSLALIAKANLSKDADLIDIGGGNSTLVDSLLELGYKNLNLLDISQEALSQVKKRLENRNRNSNVKLIDADVLSFNFTKKYRLWHDRALFHFLTKLDQRKKYISQLETALDLNGFLIISTFATDGPQKCSGLDVVRYGKKEIMEELGLSFILLDIKEEKHHTPWGSEQSFTYFLFKKNQ